MSNKSITWAVLGVSALQLVLIYILASNHVATNFVAEGNNFFLFNIVFLPGALVVGYLTSKYKKIPFINKHRVGTWLMVAVIFFVLSILMHANSLFILR